MSTPVRAVLWQQLDHPGMEYCALLRVEQGWNMDGVAVLALEGHPASARYRVLCDADWTTRRTEVHLLLGATEHGMLLSRDGEGRWWLGDEEKPSLYGCTDADLSITPATNTLPIRRLGLQVGESREIVAAWVRFPELSVQPSPQTYTRIAERSYRFESGSYTNELEVDDLGLVTRYPNAWERMAEERGG